MPLCDLDHTFRIIVTCITFCLLGATCVFAVYEVYSVGGAVTSLCVALMIKGGNAVTRRAQGVRET